MIRSILTSIFSLFFLVSFAQNEIEVKETSAKINDGNHNALSVTIYGVTKDFVEDEVRSEFRGWGRVRNRKDPLFVDDAEHRKMGDNPFDLYARVEEQDDKTQTLIVAINLGGAYMNSGEHKDRYKFMEQTVYDFAVKISKKAMDEVIEKEEEKLEELQDKMEEFNDQTEEKKELIEEKKEVIKEAEKAIKKAEKNLEELKEKRSEQKSKIKEQEKQVEKAEEKKKAIK